LSHMSSQCKTGFFDEADSESVLRDIIFDYYNNIRGNIYMPKFYNMIRTVAIKEIPENFNVIYESSDNCTVCKTDGNFYILSNKGVEPEKIISDNVNEAIANDARYKLMREALKDLRAAINERFGSKKQTIVAQNTLGFYEIVVYNSMYCKGEDQEVIETFKGESND